MSESVDAAPVNINALVGNSSDYVVTTTGNGLLRWVNPYDCAPTVEILTYLPVNHYAQALSAGKLKYVGNYTQIWMEFCNG